MSKASQTRLPGRPRDPRTDQRILEACVQLIREQGIPAASIEAVAERAGVGRPTIYRRFPKREALIEESVRNLFKSTLPDEREYSDGRAEVIGLLKSTIRMLTESAMGPLFMQMLPYLHHDPMYQRLFDEIGFAKRERLKSALIRAKKEGFIHADIQLQLLADGLVGAIYMSYIKDQGKVPISYAGKLFDNLRSA